MNLKRAFRENNSIRLGLEAKDWKEAVKLSIEPLIESKAVEERYYNHVIEITEQYGPYYVLMPGMAMPHARPEHGVNRDAFSLITLKNPVKFDTGEEAQVFLALAATSADIHTAVAIPQVIALFDLENSIQRLVDCKSEEEVYEMVDESSNSPYLEGLDLES